MKPHKKYRSELTAGNLSRYLAVLAQNPDYEHTFKTAQRLLHAQDVLTRYLSPAFNTRCRIGQYTTEGFLLIYTDSGAIAARLRAQLPSIQQKMNQAGLKVAHIKLAVLPHFYSSNTSDTEKKVRTLSSTAVEQLSSLSNTLPAESPLTHSLKQLLTNFNR